ncbi:MAG: molybdopterin-dependent oxidoreductase [Bacteroidetes bacterium]|nr:molybdopterin-dependent oxidoreductase [Bacteroidota bacterium]
MKESDFTSKNQDFKENIPTACVICSNNCGLRVDIADNKISKIRADNSNPFSNGYICNKAFRIEHYIHHKQRLTEPLKHQQDGSYKRISWNKAIEEIGERLNNVQKRHGPNAIAAVGIGGQGNHLGVLYGLATILGLGSQWWFNALAQEKTQRSLVDGWMCRNPSNTMLVGHLEESDYAIILGSNPIISHRGSEAARIINEFNKSDNRVLIVVDPRESETSRRADRHLPVKVGHDLFLLLGLTSVIIQEELYDSHFIKTKTVDFESVAEVFKNIDPNDMAQRCGIESDELIKVAREFAGAKRAVVELDLGLEQSLFNTLTCYLARLIMALTNNYGRIGGAVFAGTLEPPLPKFLRSLIKQPIAPVSGLPGISIFSPVPMFSPTTFAEEVLRDHPGHIRAVIVDGSNPVLTYPESAQIRKAFEALELSVVIETSMTETARMADYVLPTPVGYEKWEYSVFPKPFPLIGAQIRPPIVSCRKGALHEAEIYHRITLQSKLVTAAPKFLRKLAAKADKGRWALIYLAFLFSGTFLRTGFSKRTIPTLIFWLYETMGPQLRAPQLSSFWLVCQSLALTRRKDVIRVIPEAARIYNPAKLGLFLYRKAMAHPEGITLGKVNAEKHLEEVIGYSDGRIRLAPAAMMEEINRVLQTDIHEDESFPFILNGGMRTLSTANTIFRDPDWRKGKAPHCELRMNIEDASRLGIEHGNLVRVRSRKGCVVLPARLEKQVQQGHIHIPNGFGTKYPDPDTGELKVAGVNINELTDAQDRDPFTGCPHFKYVRCNVERVEEKNIT